MNNACNVCIVQDLYEDSTITKQYFNREYELNAQSYKMLVKVKFLRVAQNVPNGTYWINMTHATHEMSPWDFASRLSEPMGAPAATKLKALWLEFYHAIRGKIWVRDSLEKEGNR